MRMAGNKQRACIGGWLLAALFLLGINANQLMSLEGQPLVGYSPAIKSLKTKLQQFDGTLVRNVFSFAGDIERLQPSQKSQNSPVPAGQNSSKKKNSGQPALLPSLTGIMQVVGPGGAVYYQAVLDGKVYRAKEKVDDFTIVKISPAGVVLRRSGLKWTLDSPKPYYSSDQGE